MLKMDHKSEKVFLKVYNIVTGKKQLIRKMKKCPTSTLDFIKKKTSHVIPQKKSEQQLIDMVYSFTLHPMHSQLIYKSHQLLGGLKQIFTKEYPIQSTIFGPIYESQGLIFISKWRCINDYIGQRLQLKSRQQFQIFQNYLWKKFNIPKIKHLIIPQTFTEYMNILSNFDHPQLKTDSLFLSFVGVMGEIATFGLETIPTVGTSHKIYKSEYIYYEKEVVHHNQQHCINIIRRCLGLRGQDRFYLKLNSETLVLYNKDQRDNLQIVETLVLTHEIQVRFRVQSVTEYFNMKISNGINFIFIAFETFFDMIHFVTALNLCLQDSGYLEKNKYFSFSIQRQNCLSQYYIDGEKYFFDLCEHIRRATRQVCITDWMLTPYLLLKRPDDIENGQSRLDKILFKLADQKKVEIFILIYSEPIMMFHDSAHVQEYFQKNRRIHVIRHPDTMIPILWSHHEKMCIIDEKVAFMGGLDITYGRWDTQEHCIVDNYGDYWPGRDYRNDRLKQISSPRKFTIPDLDPQSQPRMPWHDIGIKIEGRSVIDLKRHFTQYWYFALKDLTRPKQFFMDDLQYKLRDAMGTAQSNELKETEYFTKQQELKYYQKRLKKTQSEIERVRLKQKTSKFRIIIGSNLRTYYTLTVKGWYDYTQIQKMQEKKVKHHLLRSSSNWSMGILDHVEQSIHFAYIERIKHAKEFIYIENQFFMGIEHRIIETLIERIERAYNNKENFKVIVMIPLLPGFPGSVTSNEAAVMKIQLHWQYQAIMRGNKSIFKKLQHIHDLWNYITFLGLRNHGLTVKEQRPVTEIIYIHSKMMIVDDKYALIGSANINDRSMLGSRDSQIAVVTQDSNSNSITQFRAKIFEEHFDLTHHEAVQFADPQKRTKIWNKILQIARHNTLIYREVFACYPDDTYSTFSDVENNLQKQVQKALYESLKDKIRGHAVQNPMLFLHKQKLTFQPTQLQFFAPQKTFT